MAPNFIYIFHLTNFSLWHDSNTLKHCVIAINSHTSNASFFYFTCVLFSFLFVIVLCSFHFGHSMHMNSHSHSHSHSPDSNINNNISFPPSVSLKNLRIQCVVVRAYVAYLLHTSCVRLFFCFVFACSSRSFCRIFSVR